MSTVLAIGVGKLNLQSRSFQLKNNWCTNEIVFGHHLDSSVTGEVLSHKENYVQIKFPSDEILEILYSQINEDLSTYSVTWNGSHVTNGNPCDGFGSENPKWFGGPEVYFQHWPIEAHTATYRMQPYISDDMLARGGNYGSVMERYFLNSKGYGIKIDEDVPLWVGINEFKNGKLAITAQYDSAYYIPNDCKQYPKLKYDIVVGNNLKVVHKYIIKTYYNKPVGIPDQRMFKYPIWSTWAKYKASIDEKTVLEFADEILRNGYGNSQLEIDDKWMVEYGDMSFDAKKFPNPKEMIEKLHDKGFRVTLWTIPFANTSSQIFNESMHTNTFLESPNSEKSIRGANLRQKLIRNSDDTSCLLSKWWNGFGAHVNFMSKEACSWFNQRHNKLKQDYAIDSFKFDAGESHYIPKGNSLQSIRTNPNKFSTEYVNCISHFGGMTEVRVAYNTQRTPIFVRVMDKDSNWGFNNGLKTIIPTCLQFSLLGYPFILPDMIGGNVYGENSLPEAELFVRWVQLTAFLPAMQFSVCPWQYSEYWVKDISHKYMKIHEEFVTPIVLRYAKLSTEEESPIIRPIWWLDPTDLETMSIGDQFLIGDEVLVAPVTDKGATSREIYFPGCDITLIKWRCGISGKIYEGKTWERNFLVTKEDIPYFTRVS